MSKKQPPEDFDLSGVKPEEVEQIQDAPVIGRAWVRVQLIETGHYDIRSFQEGDPELEYFPDVAPAESEEEENHNYQRAGFAANLLVELFKISLAMHGDMSTVVNFVNRMNNLSEAYQMVLRARLMQGGMEAMQNTDPTTFQSTKKEEVEQPASVKLRKGDKS